MISAYDVWHGKEYNDLTIHMKAVYQFLMDKRKKDRLKTESNEPYVVYRVKDIAEDSGISNRMVRNAIYAMKKREIIRVERDRSSPNLYRIVFTGEKDG